MRAILSVVVAAGAIALLHISSADAAGRRGDGFGRGGGERMAPAIPREDSDGGPSPDVVGAFSPMRSNRDAMERRGFIATGLEAVYPRDVNCLPIVSPFASPTRHDGTQRSRRFFEGLHGGADIAAPDGTPLLAIANGTVVYMHEGENIGGIGLFLQHSPDDTGLSVWLYTEYKHLQAMPNLKVGQRGWMGDPVGRVGNTGTTGGRAYGEEGFYHLHWTAFYSDGPDYQAKRLFIPEGGQWLDPLAVFLREPLSSQEIGNLSAERKKVRIAYRSTDGRTVPADAKIIWPIACEARHSKSQ